MLYLLRLTLCLSLCLSQALAAEPDLAAKVQEVMDQARTTGAAMQMPVNIHQEAGMRAARAAAAQFAAPAFQKQLQCEQARIETEILAGARKTETPVPVQPRGPLAMEEKLYLFVSSSMPETTVHTYVQAVQALSEPNLVMAMNGLVPGEREQYLLRITKQELHCTDQLDTGNICERYRLPIAIRPALFAHYRILQVPAVVYARGEDAWKISGDASLAHLLDQLNRHAGSPGLDRLIQTLHGN